MEITLPLPMTNNAWIDVQGFLLFDIAPHLADVATFAVHLDPDSLFGDWKVSNVETGMYVSKGTTRANAVRKAKEILSGRKDEDFKRAYESAFKKAPALKYGAA